MRRILRELAIPLIAGTTILGSTLVHRYEPLRYPLIPAYTHHEPSAPSTKPDASGASPATAPAPQSPTRPAPRESPTNAPEMASGSAPGGSGHAPTPQRAPEAASAPARAETAARAPPAETPAEPTHTAPVQREPRTTPTPARPRSDLEGLISPWQAAAISRMSVVEPIVRDIALAFRTSEATVYGIILSESSLYPDAAGPAGREGLVQYEPADFARATSLPVTISTTYLADPVRADAFDPGRALRAYEKQMVALRAASGITSLVELHALRAAPGIVYDPRAYLSTANARSDMARIETRIAEAQRLLAFRADSTELAAMRTASGPTDERLAQQYATTIRLADQTSGEFRLAYLTDAVSYARVIGPTVAIRTALDRAASETDIAAGVASLEARLDEPLGTRGP